MEAAKSQVLQGMRRKLERKVRGADQPLAALDRDGFQPTHIRHIGGPCWFVRAAPPKPVQEGLGLAPEILIAIVDAELQARTLRAAREEVVLSGLRLDGNLVVVVDRERDLVGRLQRLGGHGQRVAWVPEEGRFPSLEMVLRDQLPGFDVYEERDAVRGVQLIGRGDEVSDLHTRVARGDAVGLFGLRKMGKTSVMRAVTDTFDPASGVVDVTVPRAVSSKDVAVVMDASTVIDRTVDAVADELLAALRRRMRAAEEPEPSARGLSGWKDVGEQLLNEGRRLCVVVDEYDLLFEGESGEGAIRGIGRLFRLVRGWAQTHQGRVSLILVGRDPTYLGKPELEGVSNPLLAWATPVWLGPLNKEKADELLRKLGRRVGLDVGHRTAALAVQWTGGHPLLHRQFGSALRGVVRVDTGAWGVNTDPRLVGVPSRFEEREGVLDVMREVVHVLRKRYPRSLAVLDELARGASWEHATGPFGGVSGDPARALRNFGLVSPEGACAEGLLSYFRRERVGALEVSA